jgi:putative flippase GtrA
MNTDTPIAETATGNRLLDNQFFRFILSAGTGFIVDISAYYLFYHLVFTAPKYNVLFGQVPNDTLSLAVSFFLGVIVNFLITKFLVFTDSNLSPLRQFLRFVLVAVVGFSANLWVLKMMVRYFHWYPPVARPAAALSLFLASFFIHKFFSFNVSQTKHVPIKLRKYRGRSNSHSQTSR